MADAAREIGLRQLNSVVMEDAGGKIAETGKWPLVIDLTGNVCTFLRHRDTNLLEMMNPAHMQPEAIRLAVLGALRYGKPLVLDSQDTDLFEHTTKLFNDVQPGLMDAILDKSIIKDEVFSKMIRDSDKPEYDLMYFGLAANFQFVLVTSNEFPDPGLVSRFCPIKVQ